MARFGVWSSGSANGEPRTLNCERSPPLPYSGNFPKHSARNSSRQKPERRTQQICHTGGNTRRNFADRLFNAHPFIQPPTRRIAFNEVFVALHDIRRGMGPNDLQQFEPPRFSASTALVTGVDSVTRESLIDRNETADLARAQKPFPVKTVV